MFKILFFENSNLNWRKSFNLPGSLDPSSDDGGPGGVDPESSSDNGERYRQPYSDGGPHVGRGLS